MDIKESDAQSVWTALQSGNLPVDQAKRAAAMLADYRTQQAEYGAPLFPTKAAEDAEATKSFRSQFQGLDKVAADISPYSDDPDRDRAIHANVPFLAQRFGVPPQTIADRPDYFRNEYARVKFNVPGGIDDKAFYALASKEVNDQASKEEAALAGAHEGMRAALAGMGTFDAMPGLADDAMASPDEEVKNKAMFDAYKRTGDVLAKHRSLMTTFLDAKERSMLGKAQEGDADSLAASSRALDDLTGGERRIVLGALNQESSKRGEGNAALKGNWWNANGTFWQQVGESGGRLLNSGLAGNANSDIVHTLDSLPTSGQVRVKGDIKTAADAERYVSDALSLASSQRFADQSPNPYPITQEGEDVTLTPEQTALIVAARNRVARSVRTGQEMDAIGNAIDPIPNLFASTLGTSGALVGIMAASGGTAAPMLAGLYKGAEYEELSVKYPQMSHADKEMVSGLSGAIQAVGDFVEFGMLKNLPGLKSLLAGDWKGALIKRALGKAAGAYLVENVVEAGQDIATPALMQALTSDVPGYDWQQEKKEFWKSRADVAIGMLPLTLLGIGAASVQEYRGAKALLSWSDKLGAQGIVEPDRIAISEAAQSGNVEGAQGLLRDAWGRRDATVAAEYQERMTQQDAQTASVTSEFVRRGLLPNIRLDGNGGASITSEGKTVRFATWEQARDVAQQHMTEVERNQSEMVAAMADKLMLGKGETVDVLQKGETLGERVQAGKTTPAQAMDAAIAAGLLKGVSAQEAQSIAHQVFGGETVDERTEAIRQTVTRLVADGSNQVTGKRSRSTVNTQGNGRQFLTTVEEVVEGRWTGGLALNKFTKAQGVAWVKMAEQATGEKFLQGSTHDEVLASVEASPRALTEAISRIVVADVLGRLQNGKRITPGSIGSSFDLNDRQMGAFAAILRAFSEFFKAVLDIADKLLTARSEGKLGADYDSLFDELTGSNGQTVHENAVADALASEIVDTSGYSEETPGPNGETFSLAAEARSFSAAILATQRDTTFSLRADGYVKAFNKVLARGEGASTTIEVPGIGPVAVEWGKPGDAKKEFKRGFGLSHIIARRALIEGKGAPEWLRQLAITLARGEKSAEYGAPGNPRVRITLDEQEAVVSLERHGKSEPWLLTAYDLREEAAPGETGGNVHPASPTHVGPSFAHADVVAVAKLTVPSISGESTHSLTSHDFAARMASAMSPFDASPALRREMSRIALARVQREGSKWIVDAAKLRGSGNIEAERRTRFTFRLGELLEGKGLDLTDAERSKDAKDYEALQRYQESKDLLIKSGLTEAEAEPLARSSADKWRGNLVKNVKAATTQAKEETDAWAEKARAKSGSAAAQRKMLQGGLRTLDALLSAVPAEVRIKVGGFVKLAGLATDEAMLNEIEHRIEKLDEELTKWLRKEGLEEVTALFKRAAADYTAGKKAKGKIGPDEHHLFQRAEAASRMTEAQVMGELAKLDAILATDTLAPQAEVTAEMERGIIDLCGNLFPRSMDSGKLNKKGNPVRVRGYEGADVGRIYSAIEALEDLMRYGTLAQTQKQIAKRERWKKMQKALIAATGTTGTQRGRDEAEKVAATFSGKVRGVMLSLSSFDELLRYGFGDSELVKALVDMERDASNQYEDENQAFADGLQTLFVRLAGGGKALESDELAGERLRFSLSQKTIDTGTSTISPLQAIDALLTWRQEDGRRHMEGVFDENGKVTSTWAYDQAWVDRVAAAMPSEALEVMAWVSDNYASEWAQLNPLFRERNGVNMPRHELYSPMSVKPMTAKEGEMIDPSTGHSTTGSILTPGSLRTRSTTAVAEPDFRDAVTKIIAHKKMMAYWKAYYDLAQEMTGILGNREVMNAVEAKASREAVIMVGKWRDVFAKGGVRDASAGVALTEGMRAMTNRAATVGLLGRVSVLAVQSTQLAAASVKMPVLEFTSRLAKLTSGNLAWGDAINSDFMQRRIKSAPPIVRQAMQSLASATAPNQINRAVRGLGQLISAADGLFTGGTYAILLDYHRAQGRKALLVGAELEAYAHAEAERETEQVAQPTRTATRSFFEVASTNPLAKVGWAYASEARQKLALAAWGMVNARKDPAYAAKVMFLATVVGGMLPAVLKNVLKEAGGDDREEKWSATHLLGQTLASPFHGIPFVDELTGNGGMLSGLMYSPAAIERLLNGEDDAVKLIKDVDTILSAAAILPIPGADNLAGLAAMSHIFTDAAKMLSNAFGD